MDVIGMSQLAADSAYNVNEMAKRFDITVRQLQRKFKKSLGRTPQDWLNEERMKAAYRLLQDSESVKEVAFELGFKQVSHFCRAVKNRYGKTPTEIRVDSQGNGMSLFFDSRRSQSIIDIR